MVALWRFWLAAGLGTSLALATTNSWGQSVQACIDAHLAAQGDRDDGRLREAREKFLICAAETCPTAIRVDCADALAQVQRDLPTVVFGAKDAAGAELHGIVVREGTTVLWGGPGASAVPMNPGIHRLEATLPGGQRASVDAVVRTGDRNLPVIFSFAQAPAAQAPAPPSAPTSDRAASRRPVPALSWVFGGTAVAGLGLFAGFGLAGRSTESGFDGCKPNCAQSDYDSMKRSYLVADIGLLVGLVSAGVATYFYATRPEVHTRQ